MKTSAQDRTCLLVQNKFLEKKKKEEKSLQAFLNSFMLLGDIYKFHLSLFIRFDCYLCASALKKFPL